MFTALFLIWITVKVLLRAVAIKTWLQYIPDAHNVVW